MKKKFLILSMIISILSVGCATHVHHIGMGPQIDEKITARQWYLFYGLIPINSVNTNKMAGMDMNGNFITNYEIQTQTGPTDILIAMGLGMITLGVGPAIIQSRTVTVTK